MASASKVNVQFGYWVRHIRLWSGLLLFVYVTLHLLQHVVALGGMQYAEAVRPVLHTFWRLPVMQVALYGALLVHFLLVLWGLFFRHSLRNRSVLDYAQIVLGVLIVPMLGLHVVGTAGAYWVWGVEDSYPYVVASLVLFKPTEGLLQALSVFVAWGHGCIGVYQWIKLRPWFRKYRAFLATVAIGLPLLALGGYATLARETLLLAGANSDYIRSIFIDAKWPGPEASAWGQQVVPIVRWAVPVIIAGVLVLRFGRIVLQNMFGRTVPITYPNGRVVRAKPTMSVLDVSRAAGIPHASVCGGRGRCSTCRVRVRCDDLALEKASAEECRVLHRVGAPPDVRLACQLTVHTPMDVVPLLAPDASARDAQARPSYLSGDEREIVLLFADLRGFTQFSEHKLPFDVVFVLNQYFRVMGEAIESEGGRLDKFIGDGIMALFGVQQGPKTGAENAVRAVIAMSKALEVLNESLKPDLPQPLRMGIGLHVGSAIVGELGYGRARSLTAIGDVVNTASRLEAMSKDFGAELVLSTDVIDLAEATGETVERHLVEVRGRSQKLEICVVPKASDLRM